MKSKQAIIFFLLTLISTVLLGQSQEREVQNIKLKRLSSKEGLSQSSVITILQDKKGYLWFGTRDGLNKYDGNTFKIYRHNSQDSTSLSHSFIKSLFEDEHGNLWVGTQNGLNRYLQNEDSFKRYKHNSSKQSILNNEVWSIIAKDSSHLWVATNFGLNTFNIDSEKFTLSVHQDVSNNLSNNQIRTLLKSSNGNLWIKTTVGVDVYNAKTKSLEHYPDARLGAHKLDLHNVPVLYEDKEKIIWLGFKNGLAFFNKDSNAFEFFELPKTNKAAITDEVRSILEDYLGNLWIGTYRGLYIINQDKNKIKHFVHHNNDINSLSQNSIYKIFEDDKKDIWIGTYAGGINHYDRNDLFRGFTSGVSNNKLSYKVVSSIVEDKNNNLWVGTEGGGINFYDVKSKTFKYHTHNGNNPLSLSSNNVKSIISDSDGHLWIGTHNGGLNFLNPNSTPYNFIKFKNIPNDTLSISSNRIISLCEDFRNNIWLGTSGEGVNILNKRTKTIHRLKNISKYVGNIIYTISKSSDKDWLFIGGSKGLLRINSRTKQIEPIEYKSKNDNSLTTNPILCVYEDEQKNLWIGTEGDGLYFYQKKSGKSIKYGISEGLLSEVVYGILPDNDSNLWLSTNHGLFKFNLETLLIKNFDVSDGIQDNEFNYGSFLRSKKGDLIFGGANGLTIFNPREIVENSFIPPVLITDIKVNNQSHVGKFKSEKKITLNHNQNVLGFNFIALSFSKPSKNQYAYKLEKFDNDWICVGNKKSATYTNLDAGIYTFKVKASNSDGLWNNKGASIEVTILPAPWKTWWAYLIYWLLTIGLILIIRRYSLIRIHERNELKQERLEKEKIKEINAMKLELFTNISHDFRTPLTLIIGPLERMIANKKGDVNVQQQHKVMHRNATVLLELINQLLDFRKNESGKLKLQASKGNIVPFVENIKLSFEELAKTKQVSYTFKAENNEIKVWFDEIKLKKIVFNLLSNAFKFTDDGGIISIEISTVKISNNDKLSDFVKIEISDTGKGVSKEDIEYIFERFYQLGQKKGTFSGTGIGLALTKSLVNLHGGTIEVKSVEAQGTTFAVLLPLGKSHLKKEQILNQKIKLKDNSIIPNKLDLLIQEDVTLENKEAIADKSLATLLIVEDNPDISAFTKNIFRGNYNIFEAENGKEAIDVANAEAIDLIISDVMMPVMDGIEMCANLKSNVKTSHIPVILLTAKTSKESHTSGYKTGADAYITKPFDASILKLRVSNLIKFRKTLIDKFRKDLIVEPKKLATTSSDEKFLKKALEIVEQNLSNSEFTVDSFASEIHMSRSVLYRKLKVLTGQSISEFIRTIKLKRAGQLLRSQTDMSISQIAFDLGFNDLKYFRKCFKNLFNVLPSQYRNKS